GWMGRSHGRRNGARLGQCDFHRRRRLSVVAHGTKVKADCIRRCSGAEIDHPQGTGTMQVRRSSVIILWMAGVLGSAALVQAQSFWDSEAHLDARRQRPDDRRSRKPRSAMGGLTLHRGERKYAADDPV